MKNLMLLFTLVFSISSVLVSCQDTKREENLENQVEENIVAEDVDVEIDVDDFDKFDGDDDEFWDNDEFAEAYEADWDAWDVDTDGVLSRNEFYTATFASLDMNHDNRIAAEEWKKGYDSFDEHAAEEDWEIFDEDDDDFLNIEEWGKAFGDGGWFDDYDANKDGFIDDDEWNDGFFDDWDFNNDDMIDRKEYAAYEM